MVLRRDFLRALGAAVGAGLAGCSALTGDDSDESPNGDETATATPTPTIRPTETLSPTLTETPTGGEESTPTATPTATPTPTESPTATQSPTATPTPTPTLTPVTASDPLRPDASVDGTLFWTGVGLDGDHAVVARDGAAFTFERDGTGWAQSARLDPPGDAPVGDEVSAALVDSTVILGSPDADADGGDGAVDVFARDGGDWAHGARLTGADTDRPEFDVGRAVAFDGDVAAVAATRSPTPETVDGSVYVFERTDGEWTRVDRVTDDEVALAGSSMAVSNERLLVGGSSTAVDGAGFAGVAIVLERGDDGYRRQATIRLDDPAVEDYVGQGVALDGDRALVGATGRGEGGRAFVFEREAGEWQRTATLDSDRRAAGEFGAPVALAGDRAVVCAPERYAETGTAFVFDRVDGAWQRHGAMRSNDPEGIGYSAVVDDGVTLVGGGRGGYLFDG